MQPLVNDPICEEAVINILLSNENLYSETAEILSPKMFHTPKFAHIYNAISKIYSQGDSPNFIAVEQWLAQNEPKSGVDEISNAVHDAVVNLVFLISFTKKLSDGNTIFENNV